MLPSLIVSCLSCRLCGAEGVCVWQCGGGGVVWCVQGVLCAGLFLQARGAVVHTSTPCMSESVRITQPMSRQEKALHQDITVNAKRNAARFVAHQEDLRLASQLGGNPVQSPVLATSGHETRCSNRVYQHQSRAERAVAAESCLNVSRPTAAEERSYGAGVFKPAGRRHQMV